MAREALFVCCFRGKFMGTSVSVGNEAETFNYGVVRLFTIATVFWGVVGMAVGVWIASQLIWPQL
jgi:cytochrome c oxidase cbb3-type subunit 1